MTARLAPQAMLRPMTLHDLDAVVRIEGGAYGHPWSRGNFVDSLSAGYRAEVLCDVEGNLLGYSIAMAGADEMHLLNVTVAPASQGLGLGGRLLDALQAHCVATRLPTLWLEVRAGNLRAQALYRRRGFVEVGVRRGYYPAAHSRREDAVVMRLALMPEGG